MFALLLFLLAATCTVSAQLQAVTAPIFNALRRLSPPPILQTEHWNGTEFRYNRIVFRPARKSVHFMQSLFLSLSPQSSRLRESLSPLLPATLSSGSSASLATTVEQSRGAFLHFRLYLVHPAQVRCPPAAPRGAVLRTDSPVRKGGPRRRVRLLHLQHRETCPRIPAHDRCSPPPSRRPSHHVQLSLDPLRPHVHPPRRDPA